MFCNLHWNEIAEKHDLTEVYWSPDDDEIRTNCTIVQLYLTKEAMLRNQADIVYYVISRHSRTVGLVCVCRHRCFQRLSIFRLDMMLWNDWSTWQDYVLSWLAACRNLAYCLGEIESATIFIKYAKQNSLFHGSKYKTRRGVITHPDFDVSLFRIATIAWLSMWKLFSYFLICYPINWSQKLQVQIRGQSCLSTPNFVAMGKNTNSPLKYAPQMKWDDPELYV